MKIRKKEQSVGILGKILNLKNNSKTDTYSANYLNDRLVKVSPYEPETGEEVWIQKGKNLFDINGNVNVQGNSGNQTTYNSVSNNVLTASQNTAVAHGVGQKFTNLKGKTFTCSAKVVSAGTGNGGLLSIYEDGSEIKKAYINLNEIGSITYTGKSENIIITFATQQGINAQFTDIQVEINDKVTNYEPYINKKIYVKNDNNVYEEFYDETNLEVYSTEEQRIGTWIDGKPLYRKAVRINTLIANSSSKYEVDLSDMETLIHAYGTFVQNNIAEEAVADGAFMLLSSVKNDKPNYYAGIHSITKDGFYLYLGAGNWVARNCIVVFEYTKTTD